MWFKSLIEFVFAAGLFINSMLFLPQVLRILKTKRSHDISLLTFSGFWLLQLFSVLYGYVHHDYIMMIGFGLSLITCGIVIILTVFYRIFGLQNGK